MGRVGIRCIALHTDSILPPVPCPAYAGILRKRYEIGTVWHIAANLEALGYSMTLANPMAIPHGFKRRIRGNIQDWLQRLELLL